MRDYDHFRGYLYSNTLSWSYGAMRGRQPPWQRDLSEEPADRLVARAAIIGFDGIYIDRFGYADRAVALEQRLVEILGAQPVVSENQRLAYFSIHDVRRAVQSRYRAETVETARQRMLVKSEQSEPIVDDLVGQFSRP
jgi:phosphoglycerol transferase